MSNGTACCILGVCCPPARQREKISELLVAEGLSKDDADKAASWFEGQISALGDLAKAVAAMKKAHPNPPKE